VVNSVSYFNALNKWLYLVKRKGGRHLIFLVGMKNDLQDKKTVTFLQANTFAEENDYPFFELETADNASSDQAFYSLSQQIASTCYWKFVENRPMPYLGNQLTLFIEHDKMVKYIMQNSVVNIPEDPPIDNWEDYDFHSDSEQEKQKQQNINIECNTVKGMNNNNNNNNNIVATTDVILDSESADTASKDSSSQQLMIPSQSQLPYHRRRGLSGISHSSSGRNTGILGKSVSSSNIPVATAGSSTFGRSNGLDGNNNSNSNEGTDDDDVVMLGFNNSNVVVSSLNLKKSLHLDINDKLPLSPGRVIRPILELSIPQEDLVYLNENPIMDMGLDVRGKRLFPSNTDSTRLADDVESFGFVLQERRLVDRQSRTDSLQNKIENTLRRSESGYKNMLKL